MMEMTWDQNMKRREVEALEAIADQLCHVTEHPRVSERRRQAYKVNG